MLHPVQSARCQTRMLRQTQQGLSINVSVHTGQHMTQWTGVTSGFMGGQSDGLARRQRDGKIRIASLVYTYRLIALTMTGRVASLQQSQLAHVHADARLAGQTMSIASCEPAAMLPGCVCCLESMCEQGQPCHCYMQVWQLQCEFCRQTTHVVQ